MDTLNPRPLTWRQLYDVRTVCTAQAYRVEIGTTDGDRFRPLVSQIYRTNDPRTAIGCAVVDCMRLHPFERIDVENIRVYEF